MYVRTADTKVHIQALNKMSNDRKSRKDGKEKSGFSYYELFNSAGSNQSRSGVNQFLNDGSFLESFKKKQEQMLNPSDEKYEKAPSRTPKTDENLGDSDAGESAKAQVVLSNDPQPKKPSTLPLIGKRRGGKVLPTGMVKKAKKDEEETDEVRTDAWSHYMAEVKRYQQQSCEDERKTRPLVK